jgi:hypothetical protein
MSSPYNDLGSARLYEPSSTGGPYRDPDEVGVRVRRRTGEGEVRELLRTLERGGGVKGAAGAAGVDPKELRRSTRGVAVGVVEADELAVPEP